MYMDESSLWVKIWRNFILNVGNKQYFCKKLNKKNMVEIIYVGFFQNNSTNEVFKLQFKTIFHISLT